MSQVQAVQQNMLIGKTKSADYTPLPGSPLNERWQYCLSTIADELPAQTIQTWFRPITAISFNNNVLILRLPSRFFHEWIESHYGDVLKKAIARSFGNDTNIEFVIANIEKQLPAKPVAEKAPVPVSPTTGFVASPAAEQEPIEENCDFDHRFRFENFFGNAENNFALKAAQHIANNIGQVEYNPLVIQGGMGSGKSHLVHAFGNYLQTNQSGIRIKHMSGERFVHEYVNALQSHKLNKFIQSIAAAKVFLLDDVQFLANKTKSQEGFLFLVSELVKKKVHVIITINKAPNQLQQFNPKLISFMQKGLIIDLPKADYVTREKIVRYHLARNEIHLDEKIIHYLAEKLNKNIHDLHAVVVRIVAQISILRKSLAFDEVRYIVSQMCPQDDNDNTLPYFRKEITIDKIVNACANFFNVPMDILQGVSRKQKVIRARQIAIYLCREMTGESLNSIGYHFSNLHHASVLYAYNKVKANQKTDPKTRSTVEKIKALV